MRDEENEMAITTAKWTSERLREIASDIEDRINKTRDDEESYFLSRALDLVMEADEELGNAYWMGL